MKAQVASKTDQDKRFSIDGRQDADAILATLHFHPYRKGATIIVEVSAETSRRVLIRTARGGTRFGEMFAGEMLSRIC